MNTPGYLSDVTCGDGCSTQGPLNEACFPILVGPRDPDFSSACLQFVRTQPSTSLDCQLGRNPGPPGHKSGNGQDGSI